MQHKSGFGFEKQEATPRSRGPEGLFLWLLGGVLFFFILSGVRGVGLWDAYREGDVKSITNDRSWLAIAGAGFDKDLGHAVNQLLSLVEIYQDGDRDSTSDDRLRQVLRFIKHTGADRKDSVPTQYQGIFDLISGVAEFEDDLISLLGYQTSQTYLVVLQNTAESRPNGGFFGSFAVVKVFQGKIVDIDVRDSYILDYEKNGVKIEGPERLLTYLPHRDVHFVGANKTGFTYIDGDHIKKLYEKVYTGEDVRGVVFLRTDSIEKLIPGFTQQQRERQFTNAATDMIRGTDGFGKKELYVSQVSEILQENTKELLLGVVSTLPELISNGEINIYPHKVSVSGGRYGGGLEGWLRQVGLTTRFEQELMYIWEANVSYNKIDSFVTRQVTISNAQGQVYFQGDMDRIDMKALPVGIWTLAINYSLEIPLEYQQFIGSLERKYKVQLTDRERHILGLIPVWEARGLVHLGNQFDIVEVAGDVVSGRDFITPIPTKSAGFMINLPANNSQATAEITIKKNF